MRRLLTGLILATALAAAAPPSELRVLVSLRSFANVNPNDALAAMRVWSRQIGSDRGWHLEPQVQLTNSVEEIRTRVRQRTVDVLVLDTMDYLLLEDERMITPVLASSQDGHVAWRRYSLLTPADERELTLSGLRGAPIAIWSRTGAQVGLVWLETVLADEKLGRAATFFGEIRNVERANQCAAALYFKQVRACVMDETAFETAKEMNPQLGTLRVLLRSAPLVEGLMALPAREVASQRELVDAIMTTFRQPASRQMLLLFRSGPPVPATSETFEPMRELLRKYRRLGGDPLAPADSPARSAR